jgi:uncharacterized OsmC-like protein
MVAAQSTAKYQVEITAREHRWIADEPLSSGGDDAGPGPYELLLGALAACKIMTVKMYAERKGWPLAAVQARLDRRQVNARDLGEASIETDHGVDLINVQMDFEGELTAEQRNRLLEISERCPVHRTLTGDIRIRSEMALPVA